MSELWAATALLRAAACTQQCSSMQAPACHGTHAEPGGARSCSSTWHLGLGLGLGLGWAGSLLRDLCLGHGARQDLSIEVLVVRADGFGPCLCL